MESDLVPLLLIQLCQLQPYKIIINTLYLLILEQNIDLNSDFSFIRHLSSLGIPLFYWQIECCVIFEFKFQLGLLLFQIILIILLGNFKWTLADGNILYRYHDVQQCITYEIVGLEEVTIVELQREVIVLILTRMLEWE